MALRERSYFFDPANLDRFNSRDIPTEQTMSDWSDSVPFIKEIIDRAQLTRAGLAKTTTNTKVNNRDDADASGVSPIGFTTFVKPSQIFKVASADGSITVTENPRGGIGDDADVNDIDLSVNFPAAPTIPEDDADLVTSQDYTLWGYNYTPPVDDAGFGSTQTLFVQNQQLNLLLTQMNAKMEEAVKAIDKLRDAKNNNDVRLGDIVLTVTPPSQWGPNYLEPLGQSISQTTYADLFAIFGTTYGSGAGTFNLPNFSASKYMRHIPTSPGALANTNGGSNSYTLAEANIPSHVHTFSGVTDTDGDHTHPVPARQQTGSANSAERGNTSDGTWNLPTSGAHNHNFSGTTDAWGSGSPTAITIEPEYNGFYLKMRVL